MAKTVFITGASSGIGRATVDLFANKGWQVVATMRRPEAHTELDHRANVLLLPLDVTDALSVSRALEKALQRFGKIDVLVNNAGYGMFGPFEMATEEQIVAQFNTNVFGVIRLTKAFIPVMRGQGHGTIVNVSSIVGRMTTPLYSLYSSTKFAVEGFSESLYYELRGFGIKVKLIEPGPIRTEFNGRSKVETGTGETNIYSDIQDKVSGFNQRAFKYADKPEKVAAVIYKAATSQSHRLRYVAGFHGKLFIAFWRVVPLWKMRFLQRLMMEI